MDVPAGPAVAPSNLPLEAEKRELAPVVPGIADSGAEPAASDAAAHDLILDPEEFELELEAGEILDVGAAGDAPAMSAAPDQPDAARDVVPDAADLARSGAEAAAIRGFEAGVDAAASDAAPATHLEAEFERALNSLDMTEPDPLGGDDASTLLLEELDLELSASDIVGDEAGAAASGTAPALPLEAVEFDLALSSRDIVECGFEAAVREAAEKSSAVFLFQMPVAAVDDCQRVAALRVGRDDERHTVLVHLREDGVSFRVEDAAGSESPFAGLALSYGGLMDCLDAMERLAA